MNPSLLLKPLMRAPEILALDLTALQIIDCQSAADFAKCHAQGAKHFALNQVYCQSGATQGLLPDHLALGDALGAAGIDIRQPTVVMAADLSPSGARMAWVLRLLGMDVAWLAGGLASWQQAGGKVAAGAFVAHAIAPQPCAYNPKQMITGDDLLKAVQQNAPDLWLLDCRTLGEYQGQDVRAARGGHIPNALHFDWQLCKNDAGDDLQNLPALQTMLGALLAEHHQGQEIVCYCQSHMRSSVVCLVLAALGYEAVRGYVGSWSDWGNRADTPVSYN